MEVMDLDLSAADGARQVEVSQGASIVRKPGGHGLPVDTSTVALRHLAWPAHSCVSAM